MVSVWLWPKYYFHLSSIRKNCANRLQVILIIPVYKIISQMRTHGFIMYSTYGNENPPSLICKLFVLDHL